MFAKGGQPQNAEASFGMALLRAVLKGFTRGLMLSAAIQGVREASELKSKFEQTLDNINRRAR